jgi:peroxiredoxin
MKNYIAIVFLATTLNLTEGGYTIGDSARDFSLKNVDGKNLSMADMKSAKGFIVVFTCNHCPFAQAYEKRIMDLDKKYSSKGYPVIAINPNDPVAIPDDSYENMIKRSNEMKYSFPYLFDETQEIATSYGATRTPHVFLLNKENNKLIVKYIGAIDNNTEEPEKADKKYVEEAIEQLLSGKPVSLTETKAIGCTIKWRK